ncbi:MAG TPA: trimethylamine methyltransferase family protein [Clostridiales bacterium]|nr:trimethylamine methyltransferase family protein [Clostridiales bacterium]
MISQLDFRLLTEAKMDQIIDGGYQLMEQIGMDIHYDKARDLLGAAGCSVDGIRVKIPRELTKKALALTPSGIQIYDRNGEQAMLLEGHNSYFGGGPTCPYFFDAETGERRLAKKSDAAASAKVTDALPNIDYAMSLCMIGDQTKVLADLHEIDAMVRNTTKPIAGWAFNKENMEDIFHICEAVAGGKEQLRAKPFLIVYSEPTTPLVHTEEALEKLLLAAEYGVPCIYTPGMIFGGTAPATIAGALAVGLADTFTGLVLAQLAFPGAPFLGGTSGTPMDMKTMQTPYGAPETSLILGASNEIMRYLGIPSFDMTGATESKKIDAQAGIEVSMEAMISLLTGGNLIHDCGFMDIGMTGSVDHLVLCDEIISMAKRYCKGFEVSDETICIDTITEVGPGGNFLKAEHTFKHFRSEFWQPAIMERRAYDAWKADGAKDTAQRVHEKLTEILETHRVEPLSDEVTAKIDAIIAAAEARLG